MTIKRWFKFRPASAFRNYDGLSQGEWLAAWQWFVRKINACRDPHSGVPFEWINGTSSIHNHAPDQIWSGDEAKRRLAELFRLIGGDYRPSAIVWLSTLMIRDWSCLDNPINITCQTSDDFPKRHWFAQQGRVFRASPNSCHVKATSVHGSDLKLSCDGMRWSFRLRYGYPHDSSCWHEAISQDKRERIDRFAVRIDEWLNRILLPDQYANVRLEREKQWSTAYSALRQLFYDENLSNCEWEDSVSDILSQVNGSSLRCGRIELTESRLRTLKLWAADARRKSRRKKANA